DRGDPLAAGGWLRWPGPGRGVAAGPAAAERRGADGDVDGGDGGGRLGPSVVAVEVAGGGAFDLAGAEAGTAGGQQRGQDRASDDAGQVSWAVRAGAAGGGELLARRLQGSGEAGPVGVGAGPGLGGGNHRHGRQLIEGEQRPQ